MRQKWLATALLATLLLAPPIGAQGIRDSILGIFNRNCAHFQSNGTNLGVGHSTVVSAGTWTLANYGAAQTSTFTGAVEWLSDGGTATTISFCYKSDDLAVPGSLPFNNKPARYRFTASVGLFASVNTNVGIELGYSNDATPTTASTDVGDRTFGGPAVANTVQVTDVRVMEPKDCVAVGFIPEDNATINAVAFTFDAVQLDCRDDSSPFPGTPRSRS